MHPPLEPGGTQANPAVHPPPTGVSGGAGQIQLRAAAGGEEGHRGPAHRWLNNRRLPYYAPGSDRHGGPGAAPGGVASKNGWVYMRAQGGFGFHRRESLSVGHKTAVYSGGVNMLAYISMTF